MIAEPHKRQFAATINWKHFHQWLRVAKGEARVQKKETYHIVGYIGRTGI